MEVTTENQSQENKKVEAEDIFEIPLGPFYTNDYEDLNRRLDAVLYDKTKSLVERTKAAHEFWRAEIQAGRVWF